MSCLTPAPARLALVLVAPLLLLTACGGGGSTSVKENGTVAATGGAATVKGGDTLKFAPNVVDAKVGKLALTFVNGGQVPHNLVFDDTGLGKTATVDGGAKQTLDVTFDKAGSYTFMCTFHPGMTGKVVVS